MLCTILPVVHKYENKGYLVMSIPAVQIEGNEQKGFVIGCCILVLVIVVIFLVYIYQLVKLPIKKMTEVTKQFSKGIFKEVLIKVTDRGIYLGIKAGDIILSVNGEKVDGMKEFKDILLKYEVEEIIQVEFLAQSEENPKLYVAEVRLSEKK